MKEFDAQTGDYLAARAGIISRRLVWMVVKNKATGNFENLGLWSGLRTQAFVIDGETRNYHGAGAVLEAEPILAGPGLSVRTYEIALSAVAPEVEDLVKGYRTRGAPVVVHRALYHADTRALVAPPRRVWSGRIDQIVFEDGIAGGAASCVIGLVSETRALTRPLSGLKSHATQRQRGQDGFRRYGDISGSVPVFWGEKRAG